MGRKVNLENFARSIDLATWKKLTGKKSSRPGRKRGTSALRRVKHGDFTEDFSAFESSFRKPHPREKSSRLVSLSSSGHETLCLQPCESGDLPEHMHPAHSEEEDDTDMEDDLHIEMEEDSR